MPVIPDMRFSEYCDHFGTYQPGDVGEKPRGTSNMETGFPSVLYQLDTSPSSPELEYLIREQALLNSGTDNVVVDHTRGSSALSSSSTQAWELSANHGVEYGGVQTTSNDNLFSSTSQSSLTFTDSTCGSGQLSCDTKLSPPNDVFDVSSSLPNSGAPVATYPTLSRKAQPDTRTIETMTEESWNVAEPQQQQQRIVNLPHIGEVLEPSGQFVGDYYPAHALPYHGYPAQPQTTTPSFMETRYSRPIATRGYSPPRPGAFPAQQIALPQPQLQPQLQRQSQQQYQHPPPDLEEDSEDSEDDDDDDDSSDSDDDSQPVSTDGPPFDHPAHRQPIYDLRNNTIWPELHPKMVKGFFSADENGPTGAWTCYRRNYFTLNVSFSLPQADLESQFFIQTATGSHQIYDFAITISAKTQDSLEKSGEPRELVQHTAKRNKATQFKPVRVSMSPRPVSWTDPNEMITPQYTPYNGPPARTGILAYDAPRPSPYDGRFLPPSSPPSSYTYERVQFSRATANNGKRRAHQQFFHLLVHLWVQISKDNGEDGWIEIVSRQSAPAVVRGRSPGHYKDNAGGTKKKKKKSSHKKKRKGKSSRHGNGNSHSNNGTSHAQRYSPYNRGTTESTRRQYPPPSLPSAQAGYQPGIMSHRPVERDQYSSDDNTTPTMFSDSNTPSSEGYREVRVDGPNLITMTQAHPQDLPSLYHPYPF